MKRNLNKAFTLIELLAVIVILAIIALIATPIILGIVEDARKDAFLRSVELVVSTINIDIANKTFEEMYTYEIVDGDISNLEIGVKNTKGMNGTITYDTNGNEEYAIHNGVYCVRKTSNMENAEISDFDGECANIEYTDASCFVTAKAVVYEITDKEACLASIGETGVQSDIGLTLCNNEPINGMTLTESMQALEDEMGLENTLPMISEIGVTRIEKDDEVAIIDYTCEDTDVVIPTKIDGIPVTSITKQSFKNKGLTSVRFPNSITKIGTEAFSENRLSGELDLSHLTNLTMIEYYAFAGSDDGSSNQISSIKLPSSIKRIDEHAFSNNKINGELDLSHLINLTTLSGFLNNEIYSIKLPSSVVNIGMDAFRDNALTSVIFYGRSDLTEVSVGTNAWGWAEGYSDANIYFVNE